MAIRPAPPWETILKRNSVERLKHNLFPTELANQWERVAGTPYENLPEEDIVRRQWFGLYHDKPKIGGFMMRVKIPSGILSARGLRTIGEIAERRARGEGELTTRQNIQLHYIGLDRFPEIHDLLKSAGLTTMGGCGDVVRNITGCPVAGMDRAELFDATGVIAEAAAFFYGNREYSDLPRKHKITIAACPAQCNAPEVNCVALIGVARNGRDGFAVRVGAGQSSTPRLSRFKKTPRGQTIGASFGELNRALSKLKGRPLNEISAAFRRTGAYTLTIAAGEYRIVVRFDHDGAAVESVETGVG